MLSCHPPARKSRRGRDRNSEEYFAGTRSRSIRYTRRRVIRRWPLDSRCSLHLRVTCDLCESPREFHPELIRDFTVEEKRDVGNGRNIPGTITAAVVSWPVSFDTVLNPIRATSRSLLFFFFFFCFLLLPLSHFCPLSLALSRSFEPRGFCLRPLVPKRRTNGMKATCMRTDAH